MGRVFRAAEEISDGALPAAKWLATRKPGLYGMQDMLGLRRPGINHLR